ncbi:MAG: DUF4363 family protein [Clostridium lundense]|nr:DUF4363 family protein [Clostridium lundense]
MRGYIAVTWIICFAVMWIIFSIVLPNDEFNTHLNQIEKSVTNKDWNNAQKSMEELKSVYNKKRVFIQMNNATEIFTTFELTMGQLETSVQHKQDAAIQYIGAIRNSLDFVMKAFSGP